MSTLGIVSLNNNLCLRLTPFYDTLIININFCSHVCLEYSHLMMAALRYNMSGFFYWPLRNLKSTSLGVLSKCVASGGVCKGNLRTLFQCCTRSSGQVHRSPRAIGPLSKWGHRWQYNMMHAHCMLNNYSYRHTLRICNTYCFSTLTLVTRTHLNFALYINCSSGVSDQ